MTFSDALRRVAADRGLALPDTRHPEPLAALAYADELDLKREALDAFWRAYRLAGRPEPVVAAPVPRGYRTTTKRRAVSFAGGLALAFPGAAPAKPGVSPSALDPPEHAAVYAFLCERLARPPGQGLAPTLNWAIVRGSPGALAVILNVRVFDARVVRAGKLLGEALQGAALGVRSCSLYLDPSGSDYYLEAKRPAGTLTSKRLFGPDWLETAADGVRLRYPVTVFSQVNGPMVAAMTGAARALLSPLEGCALLDLYCGYGLFSLTVGRIATRVVGVDFDGPAVEAARANALHLGCADRARFIAGRIDGGFVAGRLRPAAGPEAVLLDPPRQGTAPDVVRAIAARAPLRVVHICCGTDEIPRELESWSRAGYRLQRAVPLDVFAGTENLETLLLLER